MRVGFVEEELESEEGGSESGVERVSLSGEREREWKRASG